MQSFSLKNIPNLDVCVLGALESFSNTKLPKINISKSKRILVVGSGNALVAGRIIFQDHDAIFADESTHTKSLSKINEAILISASGEKHAPIIAKKLKSKKIKTTLLTTNKEGKASKIVDKVLVFPKQREPYTYNTSTYLSMILSQSKESPKIILSLLKRLKIPRNISKYDSYYIIVPEEFDSLREMFHTKFDELFGPKVKGEIFTYEQTKHAKTLVPSKKQLFISLGKNNKAFGEKRLNLALPKSAGPATLMAVGYYLIGKIQNGKPPYFKKNLGKFVKDASKIFKTKMEPIVE